MPDTTTDLDLRVFCETEPCSKYDLAKPFVRSGWRYATDGKIAVRISDDGPDTENPFPRIFPKVEDVFEDFPVCDQPLPAWAAAAQIDCRNCDGYGHLGRDTCFFCGGAGRILARKGEQRGRSPDGVLELVGYYFDPWYLYLIESRTQNVLHAATVRNDRLCFTVDGGAQIVLYGISPEVMTPNILLGHLRRLSMRRDVVAEVERLLAVERATLAQGVNHEHQHKDSTDNQKGQGGVPPV